MARLVRRHHLRHIIATDNPLRELVESIISQQLSVKAADTIAERFLGLYGKEFPSAKRIIGTSSARIRNCGVSNAKVRYIKNVARAFLKGRLDREHLTKTSDIKGVGPWTAEMFLIFALGRPDVFSPGDVGLQNAIRTQYKKSPTPALMKRLSDRWSPYRSFACRYLWRSLDNE